MEAMRNTYKILVRRPEGNDHLRDLAIDEGYLGDMEK
jgi:hypothetical protein